MSGRPIESLHDDFMMVAEKELMAFERRERELRKQERKERAEQLKLPVLVRDLSKLGGSLRSAARYHHEAAGQTRHGCDEKSHF